MFNTNLDIRSTKLLSHLGKVLNNPNESIKKTDKTIEVNYNTPIFGVYLEALANVFQLKTSDIEDVKHLDIVNTDLHVYTKVYHITYI